MFKYNKVNPILIKYLCLETDVADAKILLHKRKRTDLHRNASNVLS